VADTRRQRDLVIGLGNPLRQDDGVAWQLLQELEADPDNPQAAQATLRICRQLLPELAAELPLQGRVLFVDAWLQPEGQEPRLEALAPDPAGVADPHQLTPAGLLALGEQLFAAHPAAAILLVPGSAFGHGEGLSPSVRRQLPDARRLLRQWLAAGEVKPMEPSEQTGPARQGPCTS
jgi:hydrogenase maturation protease